MATRILSIQKACRGQGTDIQSALEWMGGAETLSRPARSDLEWVKIIENGLSTEALESAVAYTFHGRP